MVRAKALTQRILRVRKGIAVYGPSPANRSEIELAEELRITLDGAPFVWADGDEEDPDRVMIFSTASNMAILKREKDWYMDGTFEVNDIVSPFIY